MTFQPGNNLGGRKQGSRNRRTETLWGKLEEQGHIDPAEHLSGIVSDPEQPPELRAAAANYLLPYKYSKPGATPALRFIEEPLQIPPPTTIAQARENITFISDLKAQGRLDLDAADGLINDQKLAASILIEEAKLAMQGQGQGDQIIRIDGGLPGLPGCENLIMPQLNGHELPGEALPAPEPLIESITQENPNAD